MELVVDANGVALAGTLWMPEVPPSAALLMHPGSGPSDRHNDEFFPPIRAVLVGAGLAVASLDKRGVGGSAGRWEHADIADQAADARAAAAVIRKELPSTVPLGLFGHSQGGWVVLEAAARDPRTAFVVTSSAPGVSPFHQELYSTECSLRSAGLDGPKLDDVMARVDDVFQLMRAGVPFGRVDAEVRRIWGDTPEQLKRWMFLPDDEAVWELAVRIIDHDPRPAMARIGCPVLAVFGSADDVTPVDASVASFRAGIREDLLEVALIPGGNHRMQVAGTDRLAEGYLDRLVAFVRAHS